VLIFPGGPAASAFRLQKRLLSIREKVPSAANLNARFLHLIDLEGELTAGRQKILEDLLGYASSPVAQGISENTVKFTVLPRLGTVSPWSTKATDIIHRCDLDQVRRAERGIVWQIDVANECSGREIAAFLHDPMTESIITNDAGLEQVFRQAEAAPLQWIEILDDGRESLANASRDLGFTLTCDEMDYVIQGYRGLGRDPTDVELMMFAQVNSEHCRHKIFNATWEVDGVSQNASLFQMIQATQEGKENGTLSAYRDNAAVIAAGASSWFLPDTSTREYRYLAEPAHLIAKVETHNHPTGISPFPGAATGSGGEIRDEGATGRGGWAKAGITGFSVSDLRLPGAGQPWEESFCHPSRLATPLQIMLEGPIGAASFNNEFGRPNIGGYFRTLEISEHDDGTHRRRGYHKPIMLAGGLGSIRTAHVHKQEIPPGAKLVILGGPAMLIGLGGGAASSVGSGASSEMLDFSSVQRANPEMQRRCQEVINRCIALGDTNPILSIHDVGAGGLCNALPEIVQGAQRGGAIDLRDIPSDDPGMSPMQIWCNEAQERYVLALPADRLTQFEAICERERCPCRIVGTATAERRLTVRDAQFTGEKDEQARANSGRPVELDMEFLFGKPPRMHRQCWRRPPQQKTLDLSGVTVEEAVERVLRLPGVADKSFLITIGDRSVGGRVVRDPMVGPWQVPVADVGVTSAGFNGRRGEAMSIGERSPIALADPAASGRMAVAEAITNMAAAGVGELAALKLSANWMAAADQAGGDADLFDAVHAVALDFCTSLGLSIPVGKDSLSMATRWQQDGRPCEVIAPLSLVVTAFAPVSNVHTTWTPTLRTDVESVLVFIDLASGRCRLGGSALAQVYGQVGSDTPDVESTAAISDFFAATRELMQRGQVLSYHDRSDGGLFVTLAEMAFAGRCGIEVDLEERDSLAVLFNEELGAVLQIEKNELNSVLGILKKHGLASHSNVIGIVSSAHADIWLRAGGHSLYRRCGRDLHRIWSETTWRMQTLRDHPQCAQQDYDRLLDRSDPGLHVEISDHLKSKLRAPAILSGLRPRIAILREQGINGQIEMAAAFDLAGFSATDVTMTDLLCGRENLVDFSGIAACGGFSFGDVLGAGLGWAKSILHQPGLRDLFATFFDRQDTFALGVCNGCQMLAALKELIPGADAWPGFVRNRSEQFESRLVMVEIVESESILFSGMAQSRLPIVVAHGEGRVQFERTADRDRLCQSSRVSLRYVDNYDRVTDRYPANPNGSADGVTGFCSQDGRVTIMMPHPERMVRTINCSWYPSDWGEFTPWLRIFQNARSFCD